MLKIFVVQCHPRNIFNIELFPNYDTVYSYSYCIAMYPFPNYVVPASLSILCACPAAGYSCSETTISSYKQHSLCLTIVSDAPIATTFSNQSDTNNL